MKSPSKLKAINEFPEALILWNTNISMHQMAGYNSSTISHAVDLRNPNRENCAYRRAPNLWAYMLSGKYGSEKHSPACEDSKTMKLS